MAWVGTPNQEAGTSYDCIYALYALYAPWGKKRDKNTSNKQVKLTKDKQGYLDERICTSNKMFRQYLLDE